MSSLSFLLAKYEENKKFQDDSGFKKILDQIKGEKFYSKNLDEEMTQETLDELIAKEKKVVFRSILIELKTYALEHKLI